MLVVATSVTILRPVGEVQAQFGDVGYHQRNGHHRGVDFCVTEQTPEYCDYVQETRIGPLRLRQGFHLIRGDPAHQVNELLTGPFSPGSITFDILGVGQDAAQVTATLRSTRRGVTQIAAPLVRHLVARALGAALEEDTADLESGSYAAGGPI